MSTYARIADLPLEVEEYALDALALQVGEFTRISTVFRLRGAGHEGVGEDVTYEEADQRAQLSLGPVLPLAGTWTLDGFARHLEGIDLFPAGAPERPPSRHYRRWALESAALDLALRQAGLSLADALGRACAPVTFVVSMNLGRPATIAPVRRWLERDPGLRFKLDPDDSWTRDLARELHATGAVDTVDLKSFYVGTIVDLNPDPVLYGMVADELLDAWIEDARVDDHTMPALERHLDRLTWDAPLESLADVTGLERTPRCINIKPSRFGSLRELMAVYDHVAAHGIAAYGGGQFELGPGRGQIQYLASLFHPDGPNDVAPTGYNDPDPPDALPGPPLEPAPSATGFRWGEG